MTPEEFRARMIKKMDENRISFKGIYKNELRQLMGISKEEIDAITPGNADLETYALLISTVKEASRVNISQVELRKNIKNLGEIAIKIAEKVPGLL